MGIIKLPVTWSMCGVVEVEASSIEEAIEIFNKDLDHIPLPSKDTYVDGSFELSSEEHDFIQCYNCRAGTMFVGKGEIS